MKLRKVRSSSDWRNIKKLYNESFPENEKKPFWLIRWKHICGTADVWVLEHEGVFAGMATTMNDANLVLVDYFAVSSDRRSCGIGGKALKELQKVYEGRRFFLEIESIEEGTETQEERERRKKFYLANGMQELGVNVTLFGVDMELLGYECKVNFEEYRRLYYNMYGNWAAKNVVQR